MKLNGMYNGQAFSVVSADDGFMVVSSDESVKDLLEAFVGFYLDEYSGADGEPLYYLRERFLGDIPNLLLDELPDLPQSDSTVY